MKLVALVIMTLLPLAATAQSPVPDPWQSLAFLEGTWDANATGSGGASALGTYEFRTELANHIFARHSSTTTGCTGPASFDCDHGDLLYVYRDDRNPALKAIYFDNEGHVLHYDVTTPSPTKAVFLSDASLPGPQFRLTYELKDAVMSGAFEVRAPGQETWNTYLRWSGSKHVASAT